MIAFSIHGALSGCLPLPQNPDTFTLRLISEPETLDWNRAHTPVETYLLVNLMEGLVSLGQDLRVEPALAESWTLSPDRLVYRFTLRPGVKWSDGKPLRAQDFVYSWKRLLTPATRAAYAYLLFDIVGAQAYHSGELKDFGKVGVQTIDDRTLQVTLNHPVSHWIYIPSFWVTFPMRQDQLERLGSSWLNPGKLVTLGPYLLDSHELDSKIELKRNPDYYGNPPRIERVRALVVHDDATALNLFERRKIDFLTDISNIMLKELRSGEPKGQESYLRSKLRGELKSFPYLKTVYLGMVVKNSRSPTQNIHFRNAVAMALDRSKIRDILYNEPVVDPSWIPPTLPGYSDMAGLRFNPSLAKAELQKFSSEAQLYGKTNQIELLIPTWERSLLLGQWVQAELKKNLGIEVILQPYDNKTYRALLDEKKYPLFLSSWSADFPDADNFMSVFTSDSGNNRTGWKNSEFDRKVLQARRLPNRHLEDSAYSNLQKTLLRDDVVIVPLYHESNIALVRPGYRNLELNPINYLYLRKIEPEEDRHESTERLGN